MFIHSLVDCHLGYFHVWAVGNSAAANGRVQVFVRTCVFTCLGICQGVGIAGFQGSSAFNHLRDRQHFPTAAAPLYIPTVVPRSQSLCDAEVNPGLI